MGRPYPDHPNLPHVQDDGPDDGATPVVVIILSLLLGTMCCAAVYLGWKHYSLRWSSGSQQVCSSPVSRREGGQAYDSFTGETEGELGSGGRGGEGGEGDKERGQRWTVW